MAIAQDPSPVVHPCKHSLVPIALPYLPDSARFAGPQIYWTKAFHNIDKALKQSIQNAQRTFQGFSTNNPLFQLLTHVQRQFHVTVQGFCTQQRQRVPVANCKFAAILPGDSVAGLVVSNGISNFLNIYNTVLIVRLVLTWFPNAPPAIVSPLSTICDPYLSIFRGIIPPLGGTIDLSPILAFFVLNALSNTAAALPAELPEYMKNSSSTKTMSSMYGSSTRSQNLWLKCQSNLFRASKKRSQS